MVRDAAQDARLLTMRFTGRSFSRNQLLDLAQLLLAEKHFLANEESRRPERAAFDRGLRVLDQFRLDVGILRARKEFCRVEAGARKSLERHLGVVHFLGLNPHVMERGGDIFLKHALDLRGDRGAHQIEGIDRKERIHRVRFYPEAPDKTRCLQHLKFGFVLDAGKRFGGRFVAGGLEDAAEQNRDIFEFDAGPFFDRGNRLVAEKRVGAAEIEQELRGGRAHGGLPDYDGFLYDRYHFNQPSDPGPRDQPAALWREAAGSKAAA